MASKKPGQATWDEFHAIRKRQRSTVERLPTERDLARQKAGAAAGTANKNKNKNKKPAGTSPDTGSTASLARTGSVQQRSATGRMAFIVQPQAQFALLCVIVLDCVAAVVRLLARHGPVPALSTIMIAVDGAWWLCFVCSLLEMLLLLIRSPLGYLGDWQRMIDMVLVGLEGHYGHTVGTDAAFLLSFLRLWRVWALVRDHNARRQQEFNALHAKYSAECFRTKTLQAQLEQATAKWKHEYETRVRAETLMKQYKTDSETYQEALAFAAREHMLQTGMLAEFGVEDQPEPTAEELAAMDAATASRFVVASDGSYTRTTMKVPASDLLAGAGVGPS